MLQHMLQHMLQRILQRHGAAAHAAAHAAACAPAHAAACAAARIPTSADDLHSSNFLQAGRQEEGQAPAGLLPWILGGIPCPPPGLQAHLLGRSGLSCAPQAKEEGGCFRRAGGACRELEKEQEEEEEEEEKADLQAHLSTWEEEERSFWARVESF